MPIGAAHWGSALKRAQKNIELEATIYRWHKAQLSPVQILTHFNCSFAYMQRCIERGAVRDGAWKKQCAALEKRRVKAAPPAPVSDLPERIAKVAKDNWDLTPEMLAERFGVDVGEVFYCLHAFGIKAYRIDWIHDFNKKVDIAKVRLGVPVYVPYGSSRQT